MTELRVINNGRELLKDRLFVIIGGKGGVASFMIYDDEKNIWHSLEGDVLRDTMKAGLTIQESVTADTGGGREINESLRNAYNEKSLREEGHTKFHINSNGHLIVTGHLKDVCGCSEDVIKGKK